MVDKIVIRIGSTPARGIHFKEIATTLRVRVMDALGHCRVSFELRSCYKRNGYL